MNYYGGMAQFCYRVTFLAAAATYGIVVYKSFRARVRTGQTLPNGIIGLLADENIQYLGEGSPTPPLYTSPGPLPSPKSLVFELGPKLFDGRLYADSIYSPHRDGLDMAFHAPIHVFHAALCSLFGLPRR